MLEHYEKFYLSNTNDLQAECARLGIVIPITQNSEGVAVSLQIDGHRIRNRLWTQPIQGYDAEVSGGPGPLTRQRYLRYASGGFGLIWMEAVAVSEAHREHENQLYLPSDNLQAYSALVQELREASTCDGLTILLQLTGRDANGQAPSIEEYVQAAHSAAQAGFDGVDIKCCYGDALFGDFQRLRETVDAVHQAEPHLLLAARLTLYDACLNGFGVDRNDYRCVDASGPIELLKELQQVGLSILNPSNCSPYNEGKVFTPRLDAQPPHEHALVRLQRDQQILQAVSAAVPELHCVGGGFAWLRHLALPVGSAMLEQGLVSALGFGRHALANPALAGEILQGQRIDAQRGCMLCYACNQMAEAAGPVGCVIQDAETYGPPFRVQRRFDPERLQQEARRCHQCEFAPCVAASPSAVPIPEVLRHFAAGRYARAYALIREHNVFPEMSAHLCPSWLQAEAACIEQTLSGRTIPIGDVQMTLARWGRDTPDAGVRLPEHPSGKTVGIVGGGPSGLAAATRLLEKGHAVTIFEREPFLGGVPARVIPASRFPGTELEMNKVLAPALKQARLDIRFGQTLGAELTLGALQSSHNAVLLAVGLGEELSLGQAPGVVDALTFLRQCKEGTFSQVPERVAILSGGDCAMDAAREARARGAKELFVIFEGARAQMHWHMEESWFVEQGVHCMVLLKPLGFEHDAQGQLTGVRVQRTDPCDGEAEPVAHSRSVLQVGLVIEAMGLQVESGLSRHLHAAGVSPQPGSYRTGVENIFASGALCNGGASVEQCIVEGLAAADEMNHYLESLE